MVATGSPQRDPTTYGPQIGASGSPKIEKRLRDCYQSSVLPSTLYTTFFVTTPYVESDWGLAASMEREAAEAIKWTRNTAIFSASAILVDKTNKMTFRVK